MTGVSARACLQSDREHFRLYKDGKEAEMRRRWDALHAAEGDRWQQVADAEAKVWLRCARHPVPGCPLLEPLMDAECIQMNNMKKSIIVNIGLRLIGCHTCLWVSLHEPPGRQGRMLSATFV